ncbi:MAG TPA: putative selenate reductase subunit YgfK [Anaeromyxobacter sp.]|nr:putative selenate reductase subunit YgfK [Anaeromyxobacter sp.]
MERPFRPLPLESLSRWIFRDLKVGETVLGVPRRNFAIPGPRLATTLLGRALGAPLGVAAGPHTQLAQNIVASWLCGARFIELKTVQVKDELEVPRPCIDAADETYNCEWSQELRLGESFTEYLGAWVLLHALAHALGQKGPGALFAMSVGYDLSGILSPGVQRFIASMRDASGALPAAVEAVAKAYPPVRDLEIPAGVSDHVTLSTMHGCPPSEIERIARYLMGDLGVHTWVKLNPTLLGPEFLRRLLNEEGGFGIEVPDAAFEHDPTFPEAMAMAKRLARAAKGRPQSFGLKLGNTLEVVNHRSVFPRTERTMYLSGRALYPLTLALSAKVTEALDGLVPLSFAGGADALSFPKLVADGLSPVTVCTDLLRPGGYARLGQYLENLETAMAAAGAQDLAGYIKATSLGRGAPANLFRHAREERGSARFQRRERPLSLKGERPLRLFDCIAAPCQEACPAHQNIPDYLWLVAHGRASEALDVILRTNPQPGVTGSVCEHPCTERCVRNYYDAPLSIREVKRFASERGEVFSERPAAPLGVTVAVVGAGPAGLSAAYFLARMGVTPVLYESRREPGGMVTGAIPGYRLGRSSVAFDLARLGDLGVRMELGREVGRDLSLGQLRREHRFVFLAAGAQRGKKLGVPGEECLGVVDALAFLRGVQGGTDPGIGGRVLVIGGGNTAMDAARTARRVVGEGGTVTIVYRRSRGDMPADPAEVHECELEGVGVRTLLAPARVVCEAGKAVGLSCTPMKPGERDGSGRPRPVASGAPEVILPADAVIVAVGQELEEGVLSGLAVARSRDGTILVDPRTGETSVSGLFAGGDAVRGPSSVIQAIADGRAVAEEMGARLGVALPEEPRLEKGTRASELLARKASKVFPKTVPVLPVADRKGFAEVIGGYGAEAAEAEAARCLDCDDLCSLCVTVCPNRANQAYLTAPISLEFPAFLVRGGRLEATAAAPFALSQAVQVLTIGDFCNECGNCDTFCPTAGAPYREKPTFWLTDEGFSNAKGDAFRLERDGDLVALSARVAGQSHRLLVRGGRAEYRSDRVRASLSALPWAVVECEPLGPLREGDRLDLGTCATLIALLAAEPVLPGGGDARKAVRAVERPEHPL